MKRIVAGKTSEKQTLIWKFNYVDLLIAIIGTGLCALMLWGFMTLKLHWAVAVVLPLFLELLVVTSLIHIGENRVYIYYIWFFKYLARKKKFPKSTLKKACNVEIKEDFIKANQYSRIIAVDGININLIPDEEMDRKIALLGMAFNSLNNAKIIRMDKKISFSNIYDITDKRIDYYEDKLESAPDNLKIQINRKLESLNIDAENYATFDNSEAMFDTGFYMIIYSKSLDDLNNQTDEIFDAFSRLGMAPRILKSDDIKEFYSDFYNKKFDENDNFEFPSIEEKSGTIKLDNQEYRIISMQKFPYSLENAYLASLFTIPETKIIFNFRKDKNVEKINKRLNRQVSGLQAELITTKAETEKMKLEQKIATFYRMMEELNDGSNTSCLFNVEVYIMYPNRKDLTKKVSQMIKQTVRARPDFLSYKQYDAFRNLLPHTPGADKGFVDIQRDMQTSTLAGAFPFYSDKFFEDNGDIIGVTSTSPVCWDMWYNLNQKRAETRTNANLCILGASGKGKSYFMKILLLNELKKDTKIFILDPENEYEYIAKYFGGQTIDVSGGSVRINPFEVFPDLEEDGGTSANMLGKHLPFLTDFFKITLPYLQPYSRTVLDKLVVETYKAKNIRNTTDISKLKPKDFPTFDDLIKTANDKRKKSGSITEMELDAIIEISDNLEKFSKENMYGSLWNGETTLSLNNEFTTFNFRALDSASSNEIRNAQMLLITKFLNREVVKNYQLQFKEDREIDKRIILIVDEAHVFIDPNFPVALDLMKNMTKRIRKYNGSFWVATQNIADFIGFDINTKTKATAVLNNCQYTALFGLKPNDMDQVKEMYAKSEAGAFTNEEVSYLLNASQGDCLLLIDSAHRISFHTSLKDPDEETKFILQPKAREVAISNESEAENSASE